MPTAAVPAPLSLDLRRRIAAALRAGAPLDPKLHNRGPARLVRPDAEAAVAAWRTEGPSLTQAELAARIGALLGRGVSRQTAQRMLARMGHAQKKALRPSQQDRPDVAAGRAAFCALQPALAAGRLVFVGESGIRRGMRSAYGYTPRGRRCAEAAPFLIGRRLGLIGWVGLRGGCVVPLEGRVDAGVFERFVAHYLVPSLGPGDLVVWDNAQIHSGAPAQWRRRVCTSRGEGGWTDNGAVPRTATSGCSTSNSARQLSNRACLGAVSWWRGRAVSTFSGRQPAPLVHPLRPPVLPEPARHDPAVPHADLIHSTESRPSVRAASGIPPSVRTAPGIFAAPHLFKAI